MCKCMNVYNIYTVFLFLFIVNLCKQNTKATKLALNKVTNIGKWLTNNEIVQNTICKYKIKLSVKDIIMLEYIP